MFFATKLPNPKSHYSLSTMPHRSTLLYDKEPSTLNATLVLPALEEISLILQILTDSDNQTNTWQCQVTLTWNVLFLTESKGRKSETWIEAPDLSQLGFGGKLFDLSDLHFLVQNIRMVIIITILGCKENKI